MSRFIGVMCACLAISVSGWAAPKGLQIYSIDVEGGQATLLVEPSGKSMLIDTGWPGFGGRDADRIATAANLARVKKLDYVLITHYHADHVGGITQLAEKMKIEAFVDHGPNREDSDGARKDYAAYEKVAAHGKHIVVQPGEGIPFGDVAVRVLTAAGEHISTPMPGAGVANPYCGKDSAPEDDPTENARSLGVLVSYGKFRFVDLGDLTKKKERELMCPNNMIGTVDVFLVSHHGADLSNSRALVWGLHPKVAIMNNGAHKGGSPEAWQTVVESPGLIDLWQLHKAEDAGEDHNVAAAFVANSGDADGNYIKVLAEDNGTFTVSNSRYSQTKTYER